VRVYKDKAADAGLRRGLRIDQPWPPTTVSSFFEDRPSEGRVRWRPLMVVQGHLLGPNASELPRMLNSYKEYTLYADSKAGWMILGNPNTDAWALINGASPPFQANAVVARVQHQVHPAELDGSAAAPSAASGAWLEFTLLWILQVADLGLNGEIRLDYSDGFAGTCSRSAYGRGIPGTNGVQLINYSKDHFHRPVSPLDIVQYGVPSDEDGIRMRNRYIPRSTPPTLSRELVDAEPVCAPMTHL
jgi:hypothetical protein